jgi:surface polysaccharide O-acyltransferase-like enzyme
MSKPGVPRDYGIDACRFLLMIPIVMAHAWYFAGPMSRNIIAYLPLIAAHAAVPFFFITSGTVLRWQEGDAFAVVRWLLRKLLPLFTVWIVLYVIVAWCVGRGSLLQMIATIDEGGPTRHLWFLPALGFALSLVAVSLRFMGWRRTWLLAGTMAAIGLGHGCYQWFLGLGPHWLRCAILTAPLFVLIGVTIARFPPPRHPVRFGLLVVASYALQVADDLLIASAPGYSVQDHPTVTLATIPFALSLFLFARSLPATKLVEGLAGIRHYCVTIYCLHPMILLVAGAFVTARSVPIALSLGATALLLSMGAAWLWRNGTRRFQSTLLSSRPSGEVTAT